MNLNVSDWKEFKLCNLFEISIAKSNDFGSLEIGNVPFVGRTDLNNGIQGYVSSSKINKGHCITISMVGTNIALWQENDFSASQNIAILRNNNVYNFIIASFICTLINFEMKDKYSYGRTVGKTNIENMILLLPICKDENNEPIIDNTHKYSEQGYIPDFKFMEDYIKSLHCKPITTQNKSLTKKYLATTNWKDFRVGEMFEVSIAKSNDFGSLEIGTVPFVGRTELNNGIQGYVCSDKINKGHCITISMVGTNVAIWQENDFSASQNIAILRDNKINPITANFICTLINYEMRDKYSYGRTVGKTSIENMILFLPVCLKEDNITPIIDNSHKYSDKGYIPDFRLMEDYIRTLPFGDVLFGNGNKFGDSKEGFFLKNVIATYLHGPLLSKNPELADYIISHCLNRKYNEEIKLEPLNDDFENLCRKQLLDNFLN